MKDNIKEKVIKGLQWKFMERIGVQGVQFIVQIILARLLLPEEYGTVALITIFIAVANVFVQSGFGSALVQQKEVDELDCNSVFYFNLAISFILYIILFLFAPLISRFYETPILSTVLRMQSLILILGAFNTVQNSIVQREMKFQKLFKVSLGASIVQGIVGITMAYNQCGVWSLVLSTLAGSLATTIILWVVMEWKPKLQFSIKRLKILFKFGSKLLASSLIDTIYNNMYSLIVGKIYNQEMLAYYNRGQNIPNLLVTNINSSIDGVLFPALSSYQEDKGRLKDLVRRSIVTSSFLIFPMMAGLIVVSKPLTIIILTEKWLPSVPFMQLSCIAFAMWPIHTANLQAIKAIGRSDIFLKLEVLKKVIGVVTVIITIPFGIYAMIIGSVINSIVSTFINAYPNKKLLNYSFIEQWKDIMPSLIISILMAATIYSIGFLNLGNYTTIIMQVILGIIIYTLIAWISKLECFNYLLTVIKDRKK